MENSNRTEMFLDVHTHGSYLLYGYGNGQLPSNALYLNLGAVNMAQAIDRVKWPSSPNYRVGNSFHVLYATSGSACDYGQLRHAPLSYTYELPSYKNMGGLNGFLVDPDFIDQAAFETWEGFKVGARFARNSFRRRNYNK
jgi:hypothetical protein